MAKAPRLTGVASLGMGWYRPEDWDRLLRVIADRDSMHDTYAEWLASARQGERDLVARGQPVERVMVDPDELAETRSVCRWASWCLIRGLVPDGAARAEFMSDRMRLAAQRRL